MTKRHFSRFSVLTGVVFLLFLTLSVLGASAGPLPGGSLDPLTVPKYADPLPDMGVMQKASTSGGLDYYEIAVRQFQQQVLSSGLPMTKVWSYGTVNPAGTFQYPASTIEATVGTPVRVKWINDLVDENGDYLKHLLPVDQTLHWANPAKDCIEGPPRTDCRGESQLRYDGPVPISVHLHGAHVQPDSDGYPEAWWLPAANNIPAGYATEGSHYNDIFGGSGAGQGFAVFQYPNDQRATTLWFHDHSLGMTRTNVYAGPAGFYLLKGGPDDVGGLPGGSYEIPLVIQDRSFDADGSLFYPGDRAFFEGITPDQLKIPFIPDPVIYTGSKPPYPLSDVSPIWNPEFFGNTIVVNGKTWPYLDVEQRRYRLRFLNASDSRFFILMAPLPPPLTGSLTFSQIGADGGFLPGPVSLDQLLVGPAERADVIVDFTNVQVGTEITMLNYGPDEPFGGGTPGVDFEPSDPRTTGQVMQFRVKAVVGSDQSTPVANLQLPQRTALGPAKKTRTLSLNEDESQTVSVKFRKDGSIVLDKKGEPFGPTSARLGILDGNGDPVAKSWMDAITENPSVGATETWEIYNFTADAHPIHVHLVQFEIINRQVLVTDDEGMSEPPARLVDGTVRGPEPWETGTKDTVIVYPGEVARIKAKFDIPGLYVWHCHILSHEDNEMMRPYCVGKLKNCQ